MKTINNHMLSSFFLTTYFLTCYFLSLHWFDMGVFGVYNVFFDSDPNTTIGSFAHGWGRNAISHPFIDLLSIPVRGVELIVSSLGLGGGDPLVLREKIALAINPFFSSLTIFVYFHIAKLIVQDRVIVILFTVLYAFSFSNIIFALVPDTYAISGFFISVLLYYFTKALFLDVQPRKTTWFLLAIIMTSITITNIFTFFIVYFGYLHSLKKNSFFKNSRDSILLSSVALGVVVVVFYSLYSFLESYGYRIGQEGTTDWIQLFLAKSVLQSANNAFNFLVASVNAFAAFTPVIKDADVCVQEICNQFSFRRETNDIYNILILTLIIFITSINWKKINDFKQLYLCILCGLIIGFNFLLHMLFGIEMFLYSQHWFTPLCLILLCLFSRQKAAVATFLGVTLLFNLNFVLEINSIITAINL